MNKRLFDAQVKEYVQWFMNNLVLKEDTLDSVVADGINSSWFDNICVGDALGASIDEHPAILREFLPVEIIQEADKEAILDNYQEVTDLQWLANIATRLAFHSYVLTVVLVFELFQ